MSRTIAIIGAPSSAGAYAPGQEDAPRALREAGLAKELERIGFEVVDRGDIPAFRWRPDRSNPRAMNVAAVASGIEAVAAKVAEAAAAGEVPLVLGGDCTVGVGTVLGMRDAVPAMRLLYFDAHPDLNVPSSVVDGALDWMGVAHLLGVAGAVAEVAELGGRSPALDPEELVLFANSAPRCSAHELRVIAELGLANVPEERVLADPAAAGSEALAAIGDRPYLVHFDTDVIDFAELPLAENTDRNVGLAFEVVMSALDVVLSGDGLAAITVTELNPHHGEPGGETVRTFVERFTRSLSAG